MDKTNIPQDLIIMKSPSDYSMSKITDTIEQVIFENILYPDLVDSISLFHKYPGLAKFILNRIILDGIKGNSYDDIKIEIEE